MEIGSIIMPKSMDMPGENSNHVSLKATIFWNTPFTFPSTKKYCLAATKDKIVEVNKLAVPNRPAIPDKYLRPNKPKITKVARGIKGIQSI
jgi:hypothetical protein